MEKVGRTDEPTVVRKLMHELQERFVEVAHFVEENEPSTRLCLRRNYCERHVNGAIRQGRMFLPGT
ncbi:hypothetical protein GCM10011410_30570 [Hoyosella rhizosphaerae]|uniref:Uncharacterized protein n=1 Tax=Hoyosella rhizosphaerae TaxID=1755582 RepID=A0A916UJQ8_9ACTN|nr:hypothetical protein GCM10011410_30570 [Hoyosella rhizosphaerae]